MSVFSQLPSAQNNPHARVAHFRVVHSEPFQKSSSATTAVRTTSGMTHTIFITAWKQSFTNGREVTLTYQEKKIQRWRKHFDFLFVNIYLLCYWLVVKMSKDPKVLASCVLCLPFVCGKTLTNE